MWGEIGGAKVYLALGPTDLRRSINGLTSIWTCCRDTGRARAICGTVCGPPFSRVNSTPRMPAEMPTLP